MACSSIAGEVNSGSSAGTDQQLDHPVMTSLQGQHTDDCLLHPVVVTEELYAKKRKVGKIFLFRWRDRVGLCVDIC